MLCVNLNRSMTDCDIIRTHSLNTIHVRGVTFFCLGNSSNETNIQKETSKQRRGYKSEQEKDADLSELEL